MINRLKESYGTVSQTINALIEEGYNHDFNIKDEAIVCLKTNRVLSPDDFQIDHVYRFDYDSDPEYQSILYAISSETHKIKGTLLNGYGISSDEEISKLVARLRTNETQNSAEIQSNDSTPKRPEGERTLNAPLVEMNLNEFILQLKNEATWANSDRNSITIFKSEMMRIVLIGLHENAELKPHKANGVISVQVLEGVIEFSANGQVTQISKGNMIALQEGVTHGVKALEESCFLLTLSMNK